MRSLQVWLHDEYIGILSEESSNGLTFRYSDSAGAASTRIPLSRALPRGKETLKGPGVQAFFGGLLPEGGVRRRVAVNLGLSEDNDFALLSALGGDCAGALRLLPDGDVPPTAETAVPLTEAELTARVEQLPRRPLLAGERGMRLSLAGAQSKLPVRWMNGQYALSTFDAPSTHILKPESPDFPGLAAVEAFCLDLARRTGLRAARADWLLLGKTPCLRVERYDREINPSTGTVRRIHQEDFCQALGVPSHRKYQQEGGPAASDLVGCIREFSTAPVLDLGQFLDLLVFNVLIGNADAHGKNYAWLYTEGERRLAPAYDLVATILWPELSSRMAMRIGQSKFLNEVTGDHFMKFAASNRIGKPQFRTRMQALCRRVCENLPASLSEAIELPDTFRDQLTADIPKRAEYLLR
jgi:serine/threonine-protein kinase HipA